MTARWIEKVTGPLDDKRRWRAYKAGTKQLPPSYRTAVEAIERYLMHVGPGSTDVALFEDLLDLFEQSAASRTPIRDIVGQDPVAFVEDFVSNYPEGQWRLRERDRLTAAIERVTGEDPGSRAGAP